MMADRRRLGALALTQCAAFAAVLILAAFSGHGSSLTPVGGRSPSPATSSPRATSPSQGTSSPPTSSDVTFTVAASAALSPTATPTATAKATATPKATEPTPTATGTPSPRSFQNTPVVTLDAGTLKPVTSGHLNSENSALQVVPANQSYLVCLSPPQGWKSAGGTYRLPGWICVRLPTAVAGETVSFDLEPASSSGAGGTG